jgi:PAS domain S-box-containing protein
MPAKRYDEHFEKPLRILHLEVDATDARLIEASLKSEGVPCEIHRVATKKGFQTSLETRSFDLVLSDYTMPSFDGLSALHMARQKTPETPFIFLSGTVGEERAVDSLKNGATDYVLKGNLKRLRSVIERAVRTARERGERQRIEENLHRQSELLRQITEHTDDLIAVLDLEGRRVFNNSSYGSLFGVPGELVGTDSFADIHPDDRERIRKLFFETVATGEGRRAEFRFRLKDGSVRHIESQGNAIRDQSGKVTHIVVVSRDVTERKHVELKMREQTALLDSAQDAIYVQDFNEGITYWNKGAERVYGWSAAEVVGRRASEVLYHGNPGNGDEGRRALLEKRDHEMTHVTKAGEQVTVVSRRTLLRDSSGRPLSILTIDTDITERRNLEEQLLRNQRLENLSALAGGVAHDLGNILSPVLMVAELLREKVSDEDRFQMVDMLRASAKRGCKLVSQILQLTRGGQRRPGVIPIRHLIREMAEFVKSTFPRSIQMDIDIEPDLQLVFGDATQLRQVLLSLSVNARDAMVDSGKLSIQASNVFLDRTLFSGQAQPVSGTYVLLVVSDTGSGIAPEHVDKIFQPFFTTKVHGTGLGLSTVANIVRSHDGFIEVSSEPGKGSAFKVYLPSSGQMDLALPRAPATVAPVGRGECVLLVDDELAVREMARAMLEVHRYHVMSARDGAEALALFQQHRDEISIVVTDLLMPVMDGPTLVRHIRQISPETRIVCMSGLASEHKLAELDHSSVQGLLFKPYGADELLVALRKALGSS